MKYALITTIGYCIYPLSFLTTRNKKKWCFGGTDNAKYMFLMTDFKSKGIRAIWFSNNKSEIKKYNRLGYEAYTKFSLKGLFHLMTSKVYVITHGIGDVNRWTCGTAKIVNLFHGLPYKKIGLDDNKHKMTWKYIVTHPSSIRPFDLQLSTSPLIETIFRRSFKVRYNEFVESLLPRNVILMKSPKEIEEFLEKIEDNDTLNAIKELKQYEKVYIYMPTFRDSQRDFIDDAKFDLCKLQKTMEAKNALFIFKLHPFSNSEKLNSFKQTRNIKILNNKVDVYPLLPYTTGLITDYSSIYFDYILIGHRRIIFFPFDYEKYKTADRNFNFGESYMKGEYCYCFEELLDLLSADKYTEILQTEIVNTFWNGHKDTDNIIDAIIRISNK